VVPWQYIEDELDISEVEKGKIGSWYSVPEHYFKTISRFKAMSLAELDEEQTRIEKKLGIRNNTMLTYFDRDFADVSDYRQSRHLQLVNLSLVEAIYDENNIECVLLTREIYVWQLLLDSALHRQIPCMSWNTCRQVGPRVFGRTSKGRQLGMSEAFEALLSGDHSYDEADLKAADVYYDSFVCSPAAEACNDVKKRSLFRNLKGLVSSGYDSIKRSFKLYKNNEFDRVSGRLDSPYLSLARWPYKAVNMYALCSTDFLNQNPDLGRKYLYVPLHVKPEVADMFFGKDYAHHEAYIADLAKRIPSDCVLYVKDHPAMVGRRPMSFYNNVKKLYNVEFLGPYVSNYELIKHAQATVTVTGTAGWEAYLLNRPVVALGDCIYNFLPGVLHMDLRAPDFPDRLIAYLKDFQPDEAERKAAIRACYVSSYDIDCEFRDPAELATRFDRLAWIIRELVDTWGDWVIENEQKALEGRNQG